ncbi:hypothetical protein ElyMa_003498600 [Elysia marginata]|uniref:Uncharacterized protein n=1 Tax=Elysia marginata TaxID=1093978 RepID=A0AAV4EEH0_9GAST|nr:hypothetical protein ElyMa_003498600 [Elysia marginata]
MRDTYPSWSSYIHSSPGHREVRGSNPGLADWRLVLGVRLFTHGFLAKPRRSDEYPSVSGTMVGSERSCQYARVLHLNFCPTVRSEGIWGNDCPA